MTWQPIETAPRDGTTVLIAAYDNYAGRVVRIAKWSELVQYRFEETEKESGLYKRIPYTSGMWEPYFSSPTHWMPLPVLPTE